MVLSETDNYKKMAAESAVNTYIEDGMTVGLGTGSTAAYAIKRLGERVSEEELALTCVSTSEQSTALGKSCGLKVVPFEDVGRIDVTIDGADEINLLLQLIKGLGGALLREKIIAAATDFEVIIADRSKFVDELGFTVPLPVEVLRFGHEHTGLALKKLGCSPKLRMNGNDVFVTDGGNYIYDCKFEGIEKPYFLESGINNIPGVIENGLFLNLASVALIADGNGVETFKVP